MAKKTVTTTTINNDEPEQNPAFTLTPPSDDPLAEIDAQFPNAARKIKVARWTPTGTVHVFTTSDVFDEDFLQENYGGGRYILRVYINGVLERTIEMRVEDKPGTRSNTIDKEREKTGESTKPLDRDSLLETLMLRLLSNQTPAPQQSTTSVSELAEALKAVHSITGNQNQGKPADYMEGFKAGVDMAKNLTAVDSGDWKTMAIDALKNIVPTVAGAITSARAAVPPSIIPMAPLNAALKEVKITMSPEEQMIYNAIQQLKGQCMARVPVDLVIDWAVANATNPDIQNIVRAAFTRGFDAFVATDPEIGNEPFVTWFKSLYDGLRSAFNEQSDVDDDSGGEHGDVGDAPNNAKPRIVGKS